MCILLETKSLSIHYPGSQHQALREIDLSISEGEILALVGESGSGKTTLLKTIAGLLEPDEGIVLFEGKPLPPPSRRLVPGHPDIRMVFQDFGLSPNLTVYENIKHMLRAYEPEYQIERVEELLRRCRLSGLEQQSPRTLSGGEKQRLALARALAEEPRMLLMDEPFGQLDTLLKQQLKFELSGFLEETSTTLVIVTHDPRDALGIADTLAVLQAGELIQRASPSQLYEQPATSYVAQLFGPITILPAKAWQNWYPSLPADLPPRLGIRAEHVQLATANGQPTHLRRATGVPATVVNVSYQGYYEEVIVRVGDELLLTAFYQGDSLWAAQEVDIVIDPARLIPFSD